MAMADIDDILGRLTIDEKISLVSGTDFWHTASVPRLGIPAIRVSDGPNGVREQNSSMENLQLAILVVSALGPFVSRKSNLECALLTETAIGATWNTALVESLRQLQGQEAIAKGINRVPGRIFGTGYSHLLAALFPSATLGGYANSLFWVILMIVSGVLTPHAYLNDFYRPWLFWIDPMRYFFGASLGSVLHDVAVECSSSDLVVFDAPPGSTCGQYAAAFLGSNPGYIVNPNATADCLYCPYSVGDEYLDTLDYSYGQRWWNWAVFVGFCCTNFMLVYVVVWFTKGRVRDVLEGLSGEMDLIYDRV